MNRIKTILVPLLILLGMWVGAMPANAQLEVRLEAPRKDYIVGENVVLKITIVNHTDSSIALTNTPGRSWLYLELTRRGQYSSEPPASTPRFPDLTITPGSRRAYNIELKPYFRLNQEGTYRVVATIRLPDMSTTYSSNAAAFSLLSGGTVQSFDVQARGERLKVSLKSLNVRGKNLLFGQVSNADTRNVIGACCLGEYLSFMRPRVLLDKAQNLHMLCQSTPEFFTYAVMNTYGTRRDYKILKRTGGPVDLISTGGGIRYIGVAPYQKPKSVKDTYHSATERP